jgi:anti-anti-sigma regulatory factor
MNAYGNTAMDCNGALVRAQCRQLAIVVTISGKIDSTNVDAVIEHTRRFVLAEKPFVLDLSGLDSFAPQATSLLDAIDVRCADAAVDWALVASPAVSRRLRIGSEAAMVPTAVSVADALHQFSDDIVSRQRLLPLLAKTA